MLTLEPALLTSLAFIAPGIATGVQGDAVDGGAAFIPSVIVTVENVQQPTGAFVTPPWIGFHNGSFDSHDDGAPASVPLGGDELERVAEDGVNDGLAAAFATSTGVASQVVALAGPGGPLAPGDRASVTVNVEDVTNRYFSYAAMVIPSNDTFVGNDNPIFYPVFDALGQFVGRTLLVSGAETKDAGTEVNDELAASVAFLAQAAPDTGTPEGGVVTVPSAGFLPPGTLTYPDGVLNHPVFAQADTTLSDSPLLRISFGYVDLGQDVGFRARLTPQQEIQSELVASNGIGKARLISVGAQLLRVQVGFESLTSPVTGAHLHLAPEGSNGPIVLSLTAGIAGNTIHFSSDGSDLSGPLAGQGLLALVNELAAGNVYVNVHTSQFPSGEIRGQVRLDRSDTPR